MILLSALRRVVSFRFSLYKLICSLSSVSSRSSYYQTSPTLAIYQMWTRSGYQFGPCVSSVVPECWPWGRESTDRTSWARFYALRNSNGSHLQQHMYRRLLGPFLSKGLHRSWFRFLRGRRRRPDYPQRSSTFRSDAVTVLQPFCNLNKFIIFVLIYFIAILIFYLK